MPASLTTNRDPISHGPTTRAGLCSLLAGAMLALALVLLLLPARASAQGAPSGCDYPDPGSGPLAENMCWLDMAGYDDAIARTPAGQDMSISLPGGYTVSFNVFTQQLVGSTFAMGASGVPTYPGAGGSAFGNPARAGSYSGISGSVALLAAQVGGPAGAAVDVTLRNIVVTDSAGNPVTGYAMASADAEVTALEEQITWTSDQPVDVVAGLQPPGTPVGGCPNTATGSGTNTVSCIGESSYVPPPSYGSVVVKSDNATTFTARLIQRAGYWAPGSVTAEAIAFAFVTAKVQITKNVEGRVRTSDSFDVSATSPEGLTLGSASTGSNNSAATEQFTVLPRTAGQSYTLGEAATPGSGTRLEDYAQSWSCTRNGVAIPALSTSGGTSRAVAPEAGDLIACTVTNTQLPADVAIVKSTSEPVVPGAEATYTLRVTNNGPSRATNVVASDPLPSGLSFVSASDGCSEANGTVTCAIASLDPGASQEFTVTARAAASAECDDLANTATVSGNTADPDLGNNSSTVRNCERRSDLVVTKDPSSAQVASGGQVMYTLVVKNNGPSDNSNVVVNDPMAAGLSLVSADPSQGTCSTAEGRVACELGGLKAGGSAQVLVTATVTAPAGASCEAVKITNTATVSGDAFDPNPDNNRDSAELCVPPDPPPPPFDLVVSKTANDRSVLVGEPVTYRVVVRNNGPAAAGQVTLTDTLNAPVTVVSVRATQGSCERRIPMRCELGTIAAGESVTITIVAKHREAGCRQRNAASATGAGTDSNPADNIDTVDVCVRKVRLELSKVASRSVVRGGERFSYRIRVRNPTKGEARNVKVCDRLPDGLRYVSSKPAAKRSNGRHCWTIKRLAAGKSKTFTVTVRAANGANGRLTNTATATSADTKRARAKDRVQVLGQASPVTG